MSEFRDFPKEGRHWSVWCSNERSVRFKDGTLLNSQCPDTIALPDQFIARGFPAVNPYFILFEVPRYCIAETPFLLPYFCEGRVLPTVGYLPIFYTAFAPYVMSLLSFRGL